MFSESHDAHETLESQESTDETKYNNVYDALKDIGTEYMQIVKDALEEHDYNYSETFRELEGLELTYEQFLWCRDEIIKHEGKTVAEIVDIIQDSGNTEDSDDTDEPNESFTDKHKRNAVNLFEVSYKKILKSSEMNQISTADYIKIMKFASDFVNGNSDKSKNITQINIGNKTYSEDDLSDFEEILHE